jgi:TonB family protein
MTAIAQALSAALLDFVWQGLLAAFVLWTALYVLKSRSARARYAASCVALAVMAILPVVTACLVYTAPAAWHAAPAVLAGTHPETMRTAMPGRAGLSFDWTDSLARWALPIWSLGVLLFSLRLVWASRQISALRRQAKRADAAVLALVADLQERMKLARPVRVLVSAVADCPSVVGWIKPVVLLPAATVLGLTPQQLEAVLAHELAHILRYDYLVNMLQTVAETLLFYHPAVWWASARIRHERELCCDDLAVDSCGDALCYARALTRLERLRVTTPRLALGSAGGPLLYRIRRLAGDAGWQRGPSKLSGILALSLGLICFALNVDWARGQQQVAPAPEPAAAESAMPDEPGVLVDLQGARVIHRDEVEYPEAAMEKGVQGTVVVEATLDADGVVSDARVLSGPQELRKAALQSVLQWHFTHDAAGSTRQVGIAFQLPAEGGASRTEQARTLLEAKREQDLVQALVQKKLAENMAKQARTLQGEQSADASKLQADAKRLAGQIAKARAAAKMASEDFASTLAELQARQLLRADSALAEARNSQIAVLEKRLADLHARQLLSADSALRDARNSQMAALENRLAELRDGLGSFQGVAMFAGRRLKSIDIRGLASAARDELLAKLPVHVGDTLAEDSMDKVGAALKQFDEHLALSMFTTRDGQVEIRIAAPGSKDGLEPPQ